MAAMLQAEICEVDPWHLGNKSRSSSAYARIPQDLAVGRRHRSLGCVRSLDQQMARDGPRDLEPRTVAWRPPTDKAATACAVELASRLHPRNRNLAALARQHGAKL